MRESRGGVVALVAMLVMGAAGRVEAQSLGQFRWQLAPYCNVVTVTITQIGAIYTLDGFDDLCGAATRAPLVGVATPNPNGSIGFGFTIATPEGTAVAVSAAVAFPGLSGPWHDSAGQTGTFAFGVASGGSPRPPVSAGGVGGVSTSTPNTFTALQTFAAGIRLGGSRIRDVGLPLDVNDAVNVDVLDTTVRSEAARQQQYTNNAVATSAASTLIQANNSAAGYVAALSARVPDFGAFYFAPTGGFVASGTLGVGPIPVERAGTRLMWYPGKAALRAGVALADEWDDAFIGSSSFAFGTGTRASGSGALAAGGLARASGNDAVALGVSAIASGLAATALGDSTVSSGHSSVAIGSNSTAAGDYSVALGFLANTQNSAIGSFAFSDTSSLTPLTVSGANQFRVRAAGGSTFYSNAAMNAGVSLAAGGGSWTNLSDVHRKQHFRDLDGEHVLAALRAMPIREWSYRSQDDAVRHVGPTAQDFRAAFGLGADPLGIDTVDADGIALAGVQALEARTAELRRELASLRAEIARLRSRRR